MTVAERIVRWACRLLPSHLRGWGEAMALETASIGRAGPAFVFAMGCVIWMVGQALRRTLGSALLPASLHEPAAPGTGWRARRMALVCAITAAGLGLGYLAIAGAPPSHLIQNVTAMVAGLIILLPFSRYDPVETPFLGIVALAVGVALVLTAMMGVEASGVRRWISMGGVTVQPALIGLPFVLTGFARSRDVLSAAGLSLAAVALALQPDPAMACALVAGVGVAAATRYDRTTLIVLAVATACFVTTLFRPHTADVTPFVDGVLRTAATTGPVAGVLVWSGAVALLAPMLLGIWRNRENFTVHAVFGATWLAILAAALVGNHPTPVVAYGGSAIVGYLLSTLALPVGRARSIHKAAGSGSPATQSSRRDLLRHRLAVYQGP